MSLRGAAATKQSRGARKTLFSVFLAFLVSACGITGTSPPVQYFTLPSEPPAESTTAPQYSIAVGPVSVPEVVDRPHLVLRTASTRVEIQEYARWAAPLKHEIPRVVAERLGRLLPGAMTRTSAQAAGTPPDYRVLIDVQRFESVQNESATVEAAWTVRAPAGVVATGRTVATESAASGYADLAEAHGRALAVVSRDIAAAIARLRQTAK